MTRATMMAMASTTPTAASTSGMIGRRSGSSALGFSSTNRRKCCVVPAGSRLGSLFCVMGPTLATPMSPEDPSTKIGRFLQHSSTPRQHGGPDLRPSGPCAPCPTGVRVPGDCNVYLQHPRTADRVRPTLPRGRTQPYFGLDTRHSDRPVHGCVPAHQEHSPASALPTEENP